MKKLNIRSKLGVAIFVFTFFIFTLGSLNIAGASATRGVTATEIRIGIIPDLTGPAAFGSRCHLWSINRYFDIINDDGGIYGRKIKLFIEDGKYNPSVALSSFKKLVLKEKIFAMIANMGSAAVKAQLPLFEKHKVPLISPAVASEWISHPPKKYIFSTMLSQGYCARVLIDYMANELGLKQPHIGVLYLNSEMGHESLREIKNQIVKYGFKIDIEVGYPPGSIDLSGQIAKLKAKKVDYVIVCGIIKGPVYAVKEAVKVDWKPQFIFPGVASDEHIFTLTKEAMFYGKPPLGASAYLPLSADFPTKELMLKWLKGDPKQIGIFTYNLHGVTYARTLVEGLKRAGKDLTVEGLVKAMEEIKNWDNGGQGPVTFGHGNRQGTSKVVVFRGVKGGPEGIGQWEIIKNWTEPKK